MNHNLAWPWADKCSPPQTPVLAFYNRTNENMLFTDQAEIVIYCQAGLRSVAMNWTLHRNMLKKPFREGAAAAEPANLFIIKISTAGLIPGFYDLRVKLDSGMGKPTEGVCTFGWQIDKMAIRDTRPADFAQFWGRGMDEYAKIPLDAKIEGEVKTFTSKEINEYNVKSACLPADYDPTGHKFEEVESCKISFAGPDGRRVYGWFAKPKGDGPFPAMLVLPGAGFAARPRPLEHARHGYAAFDIQIHGQDVDLPGKYPPITGYNDGQQYEPATNFYFFNVYRRAARAVEYLASRPDVNKDKIVAVGGSQGGRLSLVVAGLDKRVKAIVPCIANSPNHPHLQWVKSCNAANSDGMDLHDAPPAIDTPEGKCMAYFDPMNFSPDIKCPVMMNAGLIDPVSPAYSTWASFARISSQDKVYVPMAGHGHDWYAEFDRRAWRWLDEKLGR